MHTTASKMASQIKNQRVREKKSESMRKKENKIKISPADPNSSSF